MEGLPMLVAGRDMLVDIPRRLAKEQFIELLAAPHLRIGRIVSIGLGGGYAIPRDRPCPDGSFHPPTYSLRGR
jgi:hypothetical protein